MQRIQRCRPSRLAGAVEPEKHRFCLLLHFPKGVPLELLGGDIHVGARLSPDPSIQQAGMGERARVTGSVVVTRGGWGGGVQASWSWMWKRSVDGMEKSVAGVSAAGLVVVEGRGGRIHGG